MQRKIRIAAFCILCCLLPITGCVRSSDELPLDENAPSSVVAPTVVTAGESESEPSAQPAPEPIEVVSFDELCAEPFGEDAFPETLYPMNENEHAYTVLTENPQVTKELVRAYQCWTDQIEQRLSKAYDEQRVLTAFDAVQPPWQLLAAIAARMESPDGMPAMFERVTNTEFEVIDHGENAEVRLSLSPKSPAELFYALRGDEPNAPLPYEFFTYSYLLTLYDENGDRIENDGTHPPLAEQLTFPFVERYEYWDGWFIDRDEGSRRHTGTDILCPEGTPELACVDGVVIAAGSGDGTGNFVIIEGKDGTQYHYYHMVELSDLVNEGDRVARGQPIGLAGSTGNSTADHLHLAIVAPDGRFINPYPYLNAALDAAG